jgi:seryl-tRNA synthetase
MLDIKFIRENPEIVKKAIQNKKSNVDLDELLQLDGELKIARAEIEELNRTRNEIAKQVSQNHTDTQLMEKGKDIKEKIEEAQKAILEKEKHFQVLMYAVPNIPSDDTPIGPDESGNKILRQVGDKPVFGFEPKDHSELGKELDFIDNERAAKISGARFTYLKRDLALLEFALIQYGFSILTDQDILQEIIQKNNLSVAPTPFIPVVPPVFIKPEAFTRMARIEPKDDRYYIPSDDSYLVGSAEHTLGAMHMDEFIPQESLPLRYVGFSSAFRREAGSYGKDTKGILRLHQFDKLEMESFCMPKDSIEEQNFFVAIQEYLMQQLRLPYQVVITCTGDMGDPDARHLDIETWMPGQNTYRETHSADLMTDYQSRRLNTKTKTDEGNIFVHMNDATVFAIGRTLIAMMENYQKKEGTIAIPEVLQPYMHGKKEMDQ